jgi:hypothetical protein
MKYKVKNVQQVRIRGMREKVFEVWEINKKEDKFIGHYEAPFNCPDRQLIKMV